MRKFTKEITSLLATVAVGMSAGAASASSEEIVQLSGQMTTSDTVTNTSEKVAVKLTGTTVSPDEPVPIVGAEAPSDIVTKPPTTTTALIGTSIAETTTTTSEEELPPLMGDIAQPAVTTTIPPLAGVAVAATTTTATAIPSLIGTVTELDTTTTTTSTIPPLQGTMTAPDTTTVTTTTTTVELPPLMGDLAPADGDANCDGTLDMSDAVLIMQALSNPDKYGENGTAKNHLTVFGKMNADMNGDGLTVGDALAVQKKLLGLSEYDTVQNTDTSLLAGKRFVYEKEGFGGDFTIDFYENGKYKYYEGNLSSYIGSGTWEIKDDTVILGGRTVGSANYLRIDGDTLIFIDNGSENFYYIRVRDGEKFNLFVPQTES